MKTLREEIRQNPAPVVELLKAIRDFDKFWDLSEPITDSEDDSPVVVDVESPKKLDEIFKRIHLVLSLYAKHEELQ